MDDCHKMQKQMHYFKGWMAAIGVVKYAMVFLK